MPETHVNHAAIRHWLQELRYVAKTLVKGQAETWILNAVDHIDEAIYGDRCPETPYAHPSETPRTV